MTPRLVLFDIDGTLLRPCGLGRRSLERAFREHFGGTGEVFRGIVFHGRTDPEILRDGLAVVGADPAEILPAVLSRYLELLEDEVRSGPSLVLPGVDAIVSTLAETEGVTLGLVTGNVRLGARIKLARDGLWERFAVGAFGDDDEDRGALVRLATRRAGAAARVDAVRGRVFHVGDTEADVRAAWAGGATAVAVSTGGQDHGTLARLAPEHLFASLDPPDSFLEAVLP